MNELEEMKATVRLVGGREISCDQFGWSSDSEPISARYLNAFFPVVDVPSDPCPVATAALSSLSDPTVERVVSLPSVKWVREQNAASKGDPGLVF